MLGSAMNHSISCTPRRPGVLYELRIIDFPKELQRFLHFPPSGGARLALNRLFS